MSGKGGPTHNVTLPGALWDELLALKKSNPAFCVNPRSFILAATQQRILAVRGARAEWELADSSPQNIGASESAMIPTPMGVESASTILDAIGNAGSTGITAKQLASVTGISADLVDARLETLSKRRNIAKFGRGLWVLNRYANASTLGSSQRGASWYDSEFESTYGIKIGRYAGDIQFGPNEKLPVHRWWPYVQGFSAEFVAGVCNRFHIANGSTVLDPFCGSGTVPVVARSLGAKAIGIDMMPIVAFVSDAKCEWDADPGALLETAQAVINNRAEPTLQPPFLRETPKHFQPAVLRALLRLKQNIGAVPDGPVRKLLRLAFSSILIESSNLKRAPCLGYAKKAIRGGDSAYLLFEQAVAKIADDLRTLNKQRSSWGPPAEITAGNAGVQRIPSASVDLAITSPPYVNGMDYPTNYKIELAWLDFVDSYERLAALRASMVACDNIPRRTAVDHRPSEAVQADEWVASVTSSIGRNIRTKGAYRRVDMPEIVRKYFDDLVPVIRNVLTALKPGGRFVVVNGDSLIAGTYIPGDMIFARLAANSGFEVESFDVARTRRSGQRRAYVLRESVLTLKKPAAC